ncbi:hypothetical protein D3C87_487750 [compost metagenome]
MPSTDATDCAMGCVTKPCIRSGEAPGYWVVMVMVVLSVSGYCRTGSPLSALMPSKRISVLTTRASTGRRTKRSVNFMSASAAYRACATACGGSPSATVSPGRISTAAPLCRRNWPEVTTRSPACKPSVTTTRPRRRSAVFT